MNPTSPIDDERRLRVLESLNILDSGPEAGFDDLVHLASALCHTPISAVSLVDRDRQWFKSIVGLTVSETARDLSFCSHAIQDPHEIMVVEDALRDPRFAENGLVTGDPHIRFYAGVPLVVNGEAIGALCIIDVLPRNLSAEDHETMHRLARQAVAQLELRRTIQILEKQTVELAVARDDARANARAKAALLANLSHEIRTPMNGIVGVSSLLLRTEIDDRQRRYIEMVRGSGEALMKVLEDVLNYSQMADDEQKPEKDDTNLGEIVEEVVSMMQPAAHTKGLTLLWKTSGQVRGYDVDSSRLRQLLLHLAGTAVRLAAGGEIEFSLHAETAAEQDNIEMQLSFTGNAADVCDQLLSSVEAIRPIALALKAEISVESNRNQLVEARVVLSANRRRAATGVGEPQILVAEDNEVNSLVLASMLEGQGCKVTCVANGSDAVKEAKTRLYDLVFMDIHMPILDGLSATREIRLQEANRRTPIIAVTASALQAKSSTLRESGLDDLLMKPLTDRAVATTLKRWLPNLF